MIFSLITHFFTLYLFCCCCRMFVCFCCCYHVLHASLLPCTCNAVFYSPNPPNPPPSSSPHAYAHAMHTQALHTHTCTVVTMHTHTTWPIYVPCTPCTLLYHCHTLHAHAFSLCLLNSHDVCCPDLLRVPCVPCYVYIHRDTYALNM